MSRYSVNAPDLVSKLRDAADDAERLTRALEAILRGNHDAEQCRVIAREALAGRWWPGV